MQSSRHRAVLEELTEWWEDLRDLSTGEGGDRAQGLRLHRELLPDRVRVLCPDHPHTLTTRREIARLAGEG